MSEHTPRYRAIRKAVVATVGFTLLVAGVLMLVLPGPGLVTILAGLTVLASEFHWARRAKRRVVVWVRKRTKRRAGRNDASHESMSE